MTTPFSSLRIHVEDVYVDPWQKERKKSPHQLIISQLRVLLLLWNGLDVLDLQVAVHALTGGVMW